jgi:hypothetical protein
MKEEEKTRIKYAMIINIILCVLEIVGLIWCVVRDGQLHIDYYTQQSNIISLVASAILAYFFWRKLQRPKTEIPMWASVLKYASVVSLTITLLVVLFILIPTYASTMGFWTSAATFLLSTSMTYTHTLCPIVAIISFLYFERHLLRGWKVVWLALIPTIFYAILAITLNIAKVWEGPYPFLLVYRNPLWQTIAYSIVILGGAVAISRGYEVINRRIADPKKPKTAKK